MTKATTLKTAAIAIPAALAILSGTLISYAQSNDSAAAPRDEKRMEMRLANLTDAQKAALEQAKALHEEGKHDEAKALLESAGVPMPPHGGMMGKGEKGMHFMGNAEARSALEAGDYTAWKAAMADHPNVDLLTQDVFNKLVEAHSYQEKAHDIMESLKDILRPQS